MAWYGLCKAVATGSKRSSYKTEYFHTLDDADGSRDD